MSEGSDNVVLFPGVAAPPSDLLPLLEALLFAAGEPVTVSELCDAIGTIEPAVVRKALIELADSLTGRGLRLIKVAGGWQLRTDPRFADAVVRLRGGKPQRMSQAALESLSVIAYRQPVTRQEVDEIRGVGSGGVIKTLLEKGYLKVVGRRDEPGRPLEYGTTPLFVEMFELESLDALPTLAEYKELARDEGNDASPGIPVAVLEELAQQFLDGQAPSGPPEA